MESCFVLTVSCLTNLLGRFSLSKLTEEEIGFDNLIKLGKRGGGTGVGERNQ